MSANVRRSSRRSKPKTNSTYNVGDIVEVTRNSDVVEGRLAYNLTTGTSPNPRWLVKFDGEPWKDEELYEHVFGKVLRTAEDTIEMSRSSPTNLRGSKPSRPNNRSRSSGGSSGGRNSSASSSETEGDQRREKKKIVTFSQHDSPIGSEGDSSSVVDGEMSERMRLLASAREQRSLRRQAKIQDEDGPIAGVKHGHQANHNSGHSNKRARHGADEVVKIPMLTGTLYLYRGLHRRAEFVRKY